MSYSQVTVSGYNASPPSDDGSTDTTNRITWAGIKAKLGDALNTAVASIDTNVTTACAALDSAITSANSTLSSLSTSLSTAQGRMYAPAATTTLFVQTAAPTGWTKDTTHNNKALRLVSGTPSSGGSTAFTSVFGSRTISATEMTAHSHSIAATGSVSFARTSWTNGTSQSSQGGLHASPNEKHATTGISTITGTMTATIACSGTTSSNGSGTAMDFAVQYVDAILASKD